MAVAFVGEFQTDYLSSLIVQTGNTVYSMRIPELKEKPNIALYVALAILEDHNDIEAGSFSSEDQISGAFVVRVVGKEITCRTAKTVYDLNDPQGLEDITHTYYYDHDAI